MNFILNFIIEHWFDLLIVVVFMGFEVYYIKRQSIAEGERAAEDRKRKRAERATARKLKKIEARLQNIESSSYAVEEAIYSDVDELKKQTEKK